MVFKDCKIVQMIDFCMSATSGYIAKVPVIKSQPVLCQFDLLYYCQFIDVSLSVNMKVLKKNMLT